MAGTVTILLIGAVLLLSVVGTFVWFMDRLLKCYMSETRMVRGEYWALVTQLQDLIGSKLEAEKIQAQTLKEEFNLKAALLEEAALEEKLRAEKQAKAAESFAREFNRPVKVTYAGGKQESVITDDFLKNFEEVM